MLYNDNVKVMTVHAAKGFESKEVFVVGFDNIDQLKRPENAGYVALTRAKDVCNVIYTARTKSVKILEDVVEKYFSKVSIERDLPESLGQSEDEFWKVSTPI